MRPLLLVGTLCLLICPRQSLAQGELTKDSIALYFEQLRPLLAQEEDQEESISLLLQGATNKYLDQHWEIFTEQLIRHFRSIYQVGYFDVAYEVIEKAVQKAKVRAEQNPELAASVFYEAARLNYLDGRFVPCIDLLMSGINIREKYALPPNTAASNEHYLLGLSYKEVEQYQRALAGMDSALAISMDLGEEKEFVQSRIYNEYGNIYSEMDLLNRAYEYYRRGLTIREQTLGPSHPQNGSLHYNIGHLLYKKGEFEAASFHLEQARSIFLESEGEATDEYYGNTLNTLGLVNFHIGSLSEAENHILLAQNIFRRLELTEEVALTYRNLANIESARENHLQALRYEYQVLSVQKQIFEADDPEIAASYNNIGLTFLSLNQIDSSIYYQQKAIEILQRIPDKAWELSHSICNLGDAHLKAKQYDRAGMTYQKALDIQLKSDQQRHADIAYTCNALAKIAIKKQDLPEARSWVQKALIANHRTFADTDPAATPGPAGYLDHQTYFASLLLKAEIYRSLEPNDRMAAQQHYRLADTLLTRLRHELTAKEDKINLARNVFHLSSLAIENAVKLVRQSGDERHLTEAFYFAEKSKAGVLLQSMTANNAKHFAGIPDSLIAREEQLQSDINYYSLQLATHPASEQMALFQQELLVARQDYRALIAAFEQNSPLYFELRYADHTPTVNEIQRQLPTGAATISYFTSDSVLYLFYLDQKRFRVHQTSIDDTLAEEVAAYRQTISERYDQAFPIMAQRLYMKLFPFEIPEGITKLVLVPDGQLTTIPFEALLRKPVRAETEVNFTTLPYLLRDYHISYAPSVALYYQMLVKSESTTSSQAEGLIAYAPVFNDEEQLLGASTRRALEQIDGRQRLYTQEGNYITPLPGTAAELEKISLIFRQQQIPVQTFTHQQATEQKIKQAGIADCRYLHIATHGFINEEFPDLSGLLFYPDTSTTENHILNSGEVYGLKLNADLVTLSACETALGKINTGEGILGLSRAFLYAGANNLLVSLWKVDDEATADLMAGFYGHHLQPDAQAPFDQALRQAKVDMINSSEFSAPYYWSAFVLIGQ